MPARLVHPQMFACATGVFDNKAMQTGPNIPSAQVVIYLKMDGSGATFVDSGPNNVTVTANGAATQSSIAGAFGGKALVCGANTSDYIGVAANALFSLGDFTLTYRLCWLSGSAASQVEALVDIGGYATGMSNRFAQDNTPRVSYWYNPGAAYNQSSALTIFDNVFYEVEIGRSGSTIYMFWNGVLVNTTGSMGWAFAATPAFRVGYVLAGGASNITQRIFDDLLIANVCLHTASYTPRTLSYNIV